MKNAPSETYARDPPWKIRTQSADSAKKHTVISAPAKEHPVQVKFRNPQPKKPVVSTRTNHEPKAKAATTAQSSWPGTRNAADQVENKEQDKLKSAPASPLLLPASKEPMSEPDAAPKSEGGIIDRAKAWHNHVISDPEPPRLIGLAVTSLAFCAAIWAASRRPALPPMCSANDEYKVDRDPAPAPAF